MWILNQCFISKIFSKVSDIQTTIITKISSNEWVKKCYEPCRWRQMVEILWRTSVWHPFSGWASFRLRGSHKKQVPMRFALMARKGLETRPLTLDSMLPSTDVVNLLLLAYIVIHRYWEDTFCYIIPLVFSQLLVKVIDKKHLQIPNFWITGPT